MQTVRFDSSLDAFADVLAKKFSGDELKKAVFLRDARGLLAVVLDAEVADAEIDELAEKVIEVIGNYARPNGAVRDRNGLGASKILSAAANGKCASVGERQLRLVDRRIVGADWMAPPVPLDQARPRIAFISIKGGVGRSTALSICAAHLVRRGMRVLAVDLDLEAPGLGATMLTPEELPKFGVVDWLVENSITGIDGTFIADSIGHSSLVEGLAILPAFGSVTVDSPADALAKIARASIEDERDGEMVPFRQQVLEMIKQCEDTDQFDVVLIDGRAGLHETTAAPVLGLGAKVLMFGIDEPQTFQGYRFLLAHIHDRLACGEGWKDNAWFVQAKAPIEDNNAGVDRFNELWASSRPPEIKPETLGPGDLDVTWSEDNSPVPEIGDPAPVLRVIEDERYRAFNPLLNGELLHDRLIQVTFGELLVWLDEEIVEQKFDAAY